jgi:glycosyltransferase involved in cell wall biosynthesis
MAARRPVRVLELRSVWGTGGGPEKTILLGAARTDPSRHLVTVCYIRDTRDPVFGPAQKADGLPIEYVEVRERHSFDPAIWPALRRLVRERGIEIVHAHDYKTNLLGFLLERREPVVAMSTVHGWTGHSLREKVAYYPLDKRILARYRRLVAVSTDIRNELVRTGSRPERVETILNAIDHRAFWRDRAREQEARLQLGLPADRFVIGAVGRLEPQKRFDLLMDAFARLRSTRPDLLLAIAGDGSQRAALQAHADALGLGESCRLLGHCNDVPLVHHALDLFVQSSEYEGTPNAVLEAMALETPIVATEAGGTAELVRDGVEGLVVPTHDAAALTEAIEAALSDPAAAAARVRAARSRVEGELSFETRMQRLDAIYDELADEFRPRRDPGGGVPS